jgi:lantibiotic modifying enzyme
MNRFGADLPSEIDKYINESRDNFKKFYDRMFKELSDRDMDDILDKTKSGLLDNKKINLSFFEREIVVDLNKNIIFLMQTALRFRVTGYLTESFQEGFFTGRLFPEYWQL